MLAGLPYVVWPVGSLFILASRKRDDPYLHYHAVQGGLFGALVLLACFICFVGLAITFRLLPGSYYVSGLLGMGTLFGGGVVAMTIFFTAIFLGWRATEGEMLRLPFLGDFAEGKMLDHTGMTRRDFEKMLEESFIEPPKEEFEPIPFPTYGTPALTGKAAEVMASRGVDDSTSASQKAADILAHRQAKQAAAQQAEIAQREAAKKAQAALLASQQAANLAAQQTAALQAAQQAMSAQPSQPGQPSLAGQAAQAVRQTLVDQAGQAGQAAKQAVVEQAGQAAQRAVQRAVGQNPSAPAPSPQRPQAGAPPQAQRPAAPAPSARPAAPSGSAAQRPPTPGGQRPPLATGQPPARPAAPAEGQARSYSLIRDSAAPAQSAQRPAAPAPRPAAPAGQPPSGAPRATSAPSSQAAPGQGGQVKDLDLIRHYQDRKKPADDALRQWLHDQDS